MRKVVAAVVLLLVASCTVSASTVDAAGPCLEAGGGCFDPSFGCNLGPANSCPDGYYCCVPLATTIDAPSSIDAAVKSD